MKQPLIPHLVAIAISLCASSASASNIGVGLNIHLGESHRITSPATQIYRPSVSAYRAPVAMYPDVEKVGFVYPETIGFHVAVGVPYDLCYIQNSYYLFRDGRWLRSHGGRGPWVSQSYRELPPVLRNQKIEHIRDYRYVGERGSGRYGKLRSYNSKELEQRNDRRDLWREARREERGQWQDDHFGKRR